MQTHCYARRDIVALDKQGGHYSRHVSAMTSENLFSKSCIAAELGYRDFVIAQLRDEHFERMKPKTEEELLELMPESWVELLSAAKAAREEYHVSGARDLDTGKPIDPDHLGRLLELYEALVARAVNVTDYCANCQGNGTYNVCGNIETCGCGQRERSNGCKTLEEEDPTKE